MVTVNYVFLCAFFSVYLFVLGFFLFVFLIGGDACRNTAAAANVRARFRKKKGRKKSFVFGGI